MKTLLVILCVTSKSIAQTIGASVPEEINPSQTFLFYLHGGVVTALGDNAINQSMPEWGPYEYLNILDSLRRRGFNVISENRKQHIDDTVYTNRIVKQIDTLFDAGVKPGNILLIGASAGSTIVLNVSAKLKNKNIRHVIMGGCWPDTYKDYEKIELYGHFLSIIEMTDPHGTCYRIFEGRKHVTNYKEITLNTGLSHGFIYKGHKEWIDPIVNWFNRR